MPLVVVVDFAAAVDCFFLFFLFVVDFVNFGFDFVNFDFVNFDFVNFGNLKLRTLSEFSFLIL